MQQLFLSVGRRRKWMMGGIPSPGALFPLKEREFGYESKGQGIGVRKPQAVTQVVAHPAEPSVHLPFRSGHEQYQVTRTRANFFGHPAAPFNRHPQSRG